jgi:hypothetical protein
VRLLGVPELLAGTDDVTKDGVVVSAISPAVSLPAGGTVITVTATPLYTGAVCLFDNTPVVAAVSTSSLMTCTAPALSAGSYPLSVSNSGDDYVRAGSLLVAGTLSTAFSLALSNRQ